LGKLGVDLHQTDRCGWSALRLAVRAGEAAVVRLLGKLGADPNHADQVGVTALMTAAEQGKLAMCRVLVEELGATVDQRDQFGATAAQVAATANQGVHAPVLLYLVSKGFDSPNANESSSTTHDSAPSALDRSQSAPPAPLDSVDSSTFASPAAADSSSSQEWETQARPIEDRSIAMVPRMFSWQSGVKQTRYSPLHFRIGA
jgi:ankyrin repeat protein